MMTGVFDRQCLLDSLKVTLKGLTSARQAELQRSALYLNLPLHQPGDWHQIVGHSLFTVVQKACIVDAYTQWLLSATYITSAAIWSGSKEHVAQHIDNPMYGAMP